MTFTPPDTGLDNLKDVAAQKPVESKYESVYVELEATKKRLAEALNQRDEAWIEVAKLKQELTLAHLQSPIPMME